MKSSRTYKHAPSAENRDRRGKLLQRLGVNPEELKSSPKIGPLFKQCDIAPARVIEVLRADHQVEASQAVVALWDDLSPADRSLLGAEVLEVLSIAAGLNPRRLWEIYSGANMMQSREKVRNMLADALPDIMKVSIKDAKKVKGFSSREHVFKAARILPTPQGSTTVINMPGADQPELGDGNDNASGGMLENADEFLMKASRSMSPPRALPAPQEARVIEVVGLGTDDGDDDDDAA
jgi:hypothetical protein